MHAITDLELLERCTHDDRDAFAVIVHRYQNLVCSVAYSVLGDFARSEDVGQETLVAAWKQLPQLEDLAKFRPWISSIARNKAMTALRTHRSSLPLVDNVVSASEEPAHVVINQEEQALVWQTLQGLPEEYREPLVLFYRHDCSIADVAQSMDLKESAVKQRLHRGRELLRSEVTAVVERTLKKTVPGARFTMAVMGCVAGLSASTASAAVVGTAGKLSAPVVMAAAKTGILAGVFGSLVGIAGAFLGPWLAMKHARFESERQLIRETSKRILCVLVITCVPMLFMAVVWEPWKFSPKIYITGQISLICIQLVGILLIVLNARVKMKNVLAEELVAGTPPIPQNNWQRWMSRWEGRDWTSQTTFLGLPLVQIRTSDLSGHWQFMADTERVPRCARAWIAIGDKAYGILLAVGGQAIGGIAVGGICAGGIAMGGVGVGLVSIAGITVGGLAIGGVGLGAMSYGGLAVGWLAFGGGALAVKCAFGGAAIARDFAVGGYASATEANTEIAKQFVASHQFFQYAEQAATSRIAMLALQCCWIVPLVAMFLLSYRRRDPDKR